MKKITMLLFIIIPLLGLCTEEKTTDYHINVEVNECYELVSVIFHMNGASEYNNKAVEAYHTKQDEYFAPYEEHPVMALAKLARDKNGVSYDAVADMGVHMEIVDGEVKLKEGIRKKDIDSRWGKYLNDFVEEANSFYKESKFHDFFVSNTEFYNETVNRFRKHVEAIDYNWFETYYGVKPEYEFAVIVGFNQVGNFGPSVTQKDIGKTVYSINGIWETDSLGIPLFMGDYTGLLIHEFSHSFCNKLIDAHYKKMKKVSKPLFDLVENKMERQAYGNDKTMLYEILVRASVIKYYQSHKDGETVNDKLIDRAIQSEYANGFLWIKDLVNLLDTYQEGEYKSLEAFMPEIVSLQNSISVSDLKKDINENSASIIESFPKNGATDVNPSTNKIVIKFDKPMNTGCNGSTYGRGGKKNFPKSLGTAHWNQENEMEWIIDVELEPNKTYTMSFPAQWFVDKVKKYPLKETYDLEFETGNAR